MPSRGERVRAAAAAIAINLFLGTAFVTGLAFREVRTNPDSLETFDVSLPPPPPPREIEQPKLEIREPEPEGAEGRVASPVIANPSPIEQPPPVAAAPISANDRAATSGSADRGTGPGTGGAGSGSGGGGSGAGGIGSEAKLLGGNRSRLPSRLLRTIPQERGFAHLLLTIGPAGRAEGCDVLTSSGFAPIDQALCGVMVANSRWQPARDRAGQPITVKVRYTAIWSKD